MNKLRVVLWCLVALAAIAAGLLLVMQRGNRPNNVQTVQETIGGPFTLTGGDGKPFSSASLAGKPFAIFFGFTRCPDTCPTTLARLTRLRKELPQGDSSLAIVFVTVDPERDTAAEVGRYSELFASPVIGLTGTPAAIGQVKKEFSVYSKKVPTSGGDYTVDHTATVFLMDSQGRFVTSISPDESDQVALKTLRRVLD
jgi:protein SCO1/2